MEQADPEQADPEQGGGQPSDWERRRRLAEVFGDVLPETTRDERDPDARPRQASEDAGEAWLKAQVPPHHG